MKKTLLFFVVFFSYAKVPAQVKINFHSKSQVTSKGLFGKTERINETIVSPIEQKNIQPITTGLFKFAISKEVDISPLLEAFKEVNGDTIIYKQKIVALKATSIMIYFDRLTLSKNAHLYLYNPEGTEITGPITEKENVTKNNLWGSNNFKGNTIIIELKIPKREEGKNDLHIGKILFGLPQFAEKGIADSASIGNFNASSSCNINVFCPQGNGWENERKAVCLITTDDGAFGSGALVNNTCNLDIPYVLTAWHNTNGRNPNNWTYTFGWWSPVCTPNTNTNQAILFNGASLVATYEPTDFSLLKLNQTPHESLSLSYLGWSRSGTAPTSSVGIHHPAGDQMKISFASNPATIGNVRLNSNTAWRVLWTSGVTQPGSSGSPLFDQNKRVVGQLFSNTQPQFPPCNQQSGGTNYGRFDLSWTGGGTSATRLSDWLDPNNSGALTTNTTINANLTRYEIAGDDQFCSSSNPYTVNSLPAGATVTWSATPSGIVSLSQTGNSVTLTNISDGTVSLIATINNNGCISSALKTVHTGNYSPSYMPINGPTEAQCGGNMEFSVQDYPGVTYNWSFPSTWEYYSGQGTAWLSVSVPYNPGVSDGTVSVDIYDACWQNSSWLYVSSCPYYEYYSMSPNPASSTVAVSAKETTAKGEKTDKSITEVNIYDKTGNLKKRQKFGKVKKATLYISDLSPDIYIVEIVDGSYRERKKLSVLR